MNYTPCVFVDFNFLVVMVIFIVVATEFYTIGLICIGCLGFGIVIIMLIVDFQLSKNQEEQTM